MNDNLLKYFYGDELAASTWKNKYAANGEELPDEMHRRMAKEFARIEQKYDSNILPLTEEAIYELFSNFKYLIPGGSVMATLGTDTIASLSNCFVTAGPEDSYASIMKIRTQQTLLMKRRGGVGYDLSKLRPEGANVNNPAKTSTGPVSFMEVNSALTEEVAQQGRRGALMLSMHINHPDIEKFIIKKQDLSKITGANISVQVADEFMKAVEEDEDYILRFPCDLNVSKEMWLPKQYNQLLTDGNGKYFKLIKAKELWNKLIQCSWNTAEPGLLFIDRIHNYSPDGVYPGFKAVSTNPCAEIPMGPYDSCRLSHLNLTSFVIEPFTKNARIDAETLYRVSYYAMKLADDLVDLEIEAIDRILLKVTEENSLEEVDLWRKLKESALRGRRTGIGITGLADMLAMLNLKYDSLEALEATQTVMRIKMRGELNATIDMSIDRGAFPEWHTLDLGEEQTDFYDFLAKEFPSEFARMSQYGRRNLSWSTVKLAA